VEFIEVCINLSVIGSREPSAAPQGSWFLGSVHFFLAALWQGIRQKDQTCLQLFS
jgi:hypothetical protein